MMRTSYGAGVQGFGGKWARSAAGLVALLGLGVKGAVAQTALTLTQQTDAMQTQATSVMSTIGSYLLYSGLGIVTICVMIVGYKMLFKKHQWADVGHLLMGSIFIGGAGTIGGIFFKVFG